jgi:hypothetical protein
MKKHKIQINLIWFISEVLQINSINFHKFLEKFLKNKIRLDKDHIKFIKKNL